MNGFRFDVEAHEYIDLQTGVVLPHITGMLEAAGWIDTTWMTEESSARGQAVHKITAAYDLGALDLASCQSRYRGWLIAHAKAMKVIAPTVLEVEEPAVHPRFKFGGRPDRLWRLEGALAIPEVKSGAPHKAHRVQTALQAILKAPELHLPPESIRRYALYLTEGGRFTLEQHRDAVDIIEAYKVIRECVR